MDQIEKRRAFVSGTSLSTKTEEMVKKLEYIGFEGVSVYPGKACDHKKDRLKMLLSCDVMMFSDNMSGRDKKTFDMEKAVAHYLEMDIYSEELVNEMVAQMAIAPKEPSEPEEDADELVSEIKLSNAYNEADKELMEE